MAQAPEFRQMPVGDSMSRECGRKLILTELRIMARPGNGAHVGELPDSVRLERFEELLDGKRRVADGENRQGFTTVRRYERIADNSESA